jgi:uncharacterized membrane protein
VTVNQLAAIAYPDLATAEKAREELGDEIKLHQFKHTAAKGAVTGAAGGALIGLLFLAPLLGMAVGAVSGGVGTKLRDGGIDDYFMKDLGARLRPGAAALIVLGTAEARDELVARLKPYGGLLLHTSLNTREEQRVRDALAGSAATIAGYE